jgi:Uma2 family endonuclease
MSAVPLPNPNSPGPHPILWNVTEYHNMKEHGVFRGQWVFLINGQIFEQHHKHPTDPHPRPFRWTREQYRLLVKLGFLDNRRVELVYGVIYEMSPINWPHVLGIRKTADILRVVFAGTAWVNEQSPLAADASDPQPDVAVIPGRPQDYTDHPTTALILVEVADTTLFHDTTIKAELYATAGITDYWVLDLDNRRLLVFRDPVVLPAGLGATAYRTQLTLGPTDSVAPLAAPTSSVRVSDLLP